MEPGEAWRKEELLDKWRKEGLLDKWRKEGLLDKWRKRDLQVGLERRILKTQVLEKLASWSDEDNVARSRTPVCWGQISELLSERDSLQFCHVLTLSLVQVA